MHLLGEIEVVFGFWAFILLMIMALVSGEGKAIAYAESRHYTEPLFVFVILVIAASKPVLEAVKSLIDTLARWIPVRTAVARVWLCLALVPLIGSLITEPAAMTLAALMASHFGWRAGFAVMINATAITYLLRKDLPEEQRTDTTEIDLVRIPLLVSVIHLLFLAAVVVFAHHPVIFLGFFLFFLGFTQAYAQYQNPLILKECLLVGFFLAGLVILGGMQPWWLQPIVSSLEPTALFFGALGLTAITGNAALTYLGSLIEGMSDNAKYMLVVVGSRRGRINGHCQRAEPRRRGFAAQRFQ